MKAPIRVGIQPGVRVLYVERHSNFWLLPISTNPDRTLGTFMRLYDDGRVDQYTLRPDRADEDLMIIKPADTKE